MAQKELVKSEIDYALLKAAILGDSLSRIARKARLQEKDTRKQLKLLKASRMIDNIRRPEGMYYFVTSKGERFITDYESKM